MYLWVPSTRDAIKDESDKILKGNRYVVLAMEDENERDFTRRAKRP